jgi:3-deoxy-manno-octulosonate cytidylyltransferase (CMP-KDO synthetase)
MVIHAAIRASLSRKLSEVIVCTDSPEIAEACFIHGVKVFLTRADHLNGTERIGEFVEALDLHPTDILIDIQGDEPLVSPDVIDALISHFENSNYDIMLPYILGTPEGSLNYVKIVETNGRVLFMSRADIPISFAKDRKLKKHLSIIAFTPNALKAFCKTPPSEYELIESVELLRALELNLSIGTFQVEQESFSVDTREDYERAIRVMRTDPLYKLYEKRKL